MERPSERRDCFLCWTFVIPLLVIVIIIGIKSDKSVETGFFKVFNNELKGCIILWFWWNTPEFLGGRRNVSSRKFF